MTLEQLADFITPNIASGIPANSFFWGCAPCECFWCDADTCFVCGKKGTLIAKPLDTNGLVIKRPKGMQFLSNNHVVCNDAISERIRLRLRYT